MYLDGDMDSFQSFDEDITVDIKRRLFFTRDVIKSGRFIIDRTEMT